MVNWIDISFKIGEKTITYAEDCIELIEMADDRYTIDAVNQAIKESLPDDDGYSKRLLWTRLTHDQKKKIIYGVDSN